MKCLKVRYKEEILPKFKGEFKFSNDLRVPRVLKVVLNMGLGECASDSKKLQSAVDDLTAISGQRPVVTKAKKSIAGFKIREGMSIGAKVTLRKNRMYEFLDRLINIALPRTRDFHGLSKKSSDERGNYSFGIKEQIIFPEVNSDKVDQIRGLNITVCTTARSKEEMLFLLNAMNFPFKK